MEFKFLPFEIRVNSKCHPFLMKFVYFWTCAPVDIRPC